MQSSPSIRPFKPTLTGASPVTDTKVHVAQRDESATVRRWRSQVQFLPWTPFASLPLCLSSHRASFVNSYSSVRVRPEAPSGLWCNSSTSRCERDGPGANPGFLTNFSAAHVRRHSTTITHNPEAVWQIIHSITTDHFFEITSKRRKGFPSETNVKRGVRLVHGNKELSEKLGRNDLCPCGSGKKYKHCHGALA